MHQMYSAASKMSIYPLVFNIEWLLNKHKCGSKCKCKCSCKPKCKRECACGHECEHNQKHTLGFIEFWLNSIARNADRAPVVLIGTHKDLVVSHDGYLQQTNVQLMEHADIASAHHIIGEHIQKMAVYKKHQLNLFPKNSSSLFRMCCFMMFTVHVVKLSHVPLQVPHPTDAGSLQSTTKPGRTTIHRAQTTKSLRSFARC